MPVWHEATRDLRQADQIQLVGIVQEQHPERARLFAQWKQFDWPILVDSLNLLEVAAVPMALLIDEDGVVRAVLRDPKNDLPKLTKEMPAALDSQAHAPTDAIQTSLVSAQDLACFREPPRWSSAIDLLERALLPNRSEGRLHFALGVLYRARYDSPDRRPNDFQIAVNHWQAALDLNPNQYIWRRRLQQYGPRLDKPYPFYDWVDEARREIERRGETPVTLVVEPGGAELAPPAKDGPVTSAEQTRSPDPQGRVTRDDRLINAEATLIPAQVRSGQPLRLHVLFRPNTEREAHWSNEGEPMQVFVDLPAGWTASERLIVIAPPPQAISKEPRVVEFELVAPQRAPAGQVSVPVTALFGVCEGRAGQCLHRRKDLRAVVEIVRSEPGQNSGSQMPSAP